MRALLAITLAACASEPSMTTVASKLTCGTGTHEASGACVPDPLPSYSIRATKTIVADGGKVDIVVFGRNPDGTPATDAIVLNTNRPNAGTFAPPTFSLDERHHRATFTPCSSTVPGCTGPLELTVALASAPATPVARFAVELVATPAIFSTEKCLTGGNVLYLEGERFIHRGALTVVDGAFTRGGGDRRAEVIVAPSNVAQGPGFTVEFSSVQLGAPLAVGLYRNARAAPGLGQPGIKVFGADPFAYCNFTYLGEFEIHEFVFTTSLQRLTASFRQWCSDPSVPERVVSGCIHVE
jgi:hypothetical protein